MKTYYIGTQPDPEDRKQIQVSDEQAEDIDTAFYYLSEDSILYVDTLDGQSLKLRRADCGAGCRCALEEVVND